MATFTGTRKEFRRHIGPFLRNLVQNITRKHKREVSACQHCGTSERLEAAHLAGRDRNEVIKLILDETTLDEFITVNIADFESRFIQEHQPLEKAIIILCRSCHSAYDAVTKTAKKPTTKNVTTSRNTAPNEQLLPITLDPQDPIAFKNALLKSKKALIKIYFNDGHVEEKEWNAEKFSANSNVLGNLRSRKDFRSNQWVKHGIKSLYVVCVDS